MRRAIKKPRTFTRPRLYYQDATGFLDYFCAMRSPRLRIIWPNGASTWSQSGKWLAPCWSNGEMFDGLEVIGKDDSGWAALSRMRTYDKACKFKPAIFLGEL